MIANNWNSEEEQQRGNQQYAVGEKQKLIGRQSLAAYSAEESALQQERRKEPRATAPAVEEGARPRHRDDFVPFGREPHGLRRAIDRTRRDCRPQDREKHGQATQRGSTTVINSCKQDIYDDSDKMQQNEHGP